MLEIGWMTIGIAFVFFAMGLGISYLLLPSSISKYRFWLAPWFGIMLIAVLGGILSVGKLPMSSASYVIGIVGLILLAYSLVLGKIKKPNLNIENKLLLGVIVVLILFNLYPLIAKVGYPTTLSMGNLDAVSYTSVAEYLKDHTVLNGSEINVYKPYTWSVVDLLHYGFRWGPPIVLSFVGVIFGTKIYAIYTILLTVVFALIFPLVYLLAKRFLGKSSYLLMLITLLVFGLNSTLLYWLSQAFLPQFMYTGIFLTSILLLLSYINEKSEGWKITSWDIALGLCFSAIASVYPDGLILAFSPIWLYVLLDVVINKKTGSLVKVLKILGMTIVINPIIFSTAIRQIMRLVMMTTNTDFIGWEKIRNMSLFEMMGFHNLYYSRDLSTTVDWLLGLPVFYFMIKGFQRVKNKILIGSYLAVMLVFIGFFSMVVDNFFVFNRVIGYTLFMFSVLFAVGLANYLKKIKSKVFVLIAMTVVTIFSLRSSIRSLKQVYWHHRSVDQALISLMEFEDANYFRTADTVLGEYDLWERVWTEHFLRDQNIIDRQNYSIVKSEVQDIRLMLARKNMLERYEQKIDFGTVVWENEYYIFGVPKKTEVTEDLL